MQPAQKALVTGVERSYVVYYGINPLPITGSHAVWATSLNSTITWDACDPLPDDTPDLSDFVVLIRRGECGLVCEDILSQAAPTLTDSRAQDSKKRNAADKGAKYILIYKYVLRSRKHRISPRLSQQHRGLGGAHFRPGLRDPAHDCRRRRIRMRN